MDSQASSPLRPVLVPQPVDPGMVRGRRRSPLVLVVHGRTGGLIPDALQTLAEALQQRRGAPVLLQALTAPEPEVAPAFWLAAREAGGFSLVPLLLLPGGHVRIDVPALAAIWRAAARAPGAGPIPLRRFPFLGAWPAWQRLLAAELTRRAGGLPWHWLHHPLEGPLARRYLDYLAAVLGLGWRFSRRQGTTERYFLGARNFPGWAVGLSFIGSTISSVTFIAYPADSFKTAWVRLLPNLAFPFVVTLSLSWPGLQSQRGCRSVRQTQRT